MTNLLCVVKNYRTTALLIILSIACFYANAQTKQWQWGSRGGSYLQVQNNERVTSIATDTAGNVYAVATVGDHNLTVDSTAITSIGRYDQLLMSYDSDGDLRWTRVIGSRSDVRLQRMCMGPEGNLYMIGKIPRNDTILLESTPGNNVVLQYARSNLDTLKETMFIFKYSPDGELLWYRTPHLPTIDLISPLTDHHSYDLSVDNEGNSHWMCMLTPGYYADSAFHNTVPGQNIFILKYDKNGQFIDARQLDTYIHFAFPTIWLDYDDYNDRYILSGYESMPDMNPAFGTDTVNGGMYIASFNSDGSLNWYLDNTDTIIGSIRDAEIDEYGNIYIAGKTDHTDTLAGAVIAPNTYNAGHYTILIKLDPNGSVIWNRHSARTVSYPATALTISGNEVAFTGYENGTIWGTDTLNTVTNRGTNVYFARFNRFTGEYLGLDKLYGSHNSYDYSEDITGDVYGSYVVGGWFDQYMYVADDTLFENAQGSDFFVAKYGTGITNCARPMASFDHTVGDSLLVTFTHNGTVLFDSITWEFDGSTYLHTQDQQYEHVFDSAGTYQICMTIFNDCGYDYQCADVYVPFVADTTTTPTDTTTNPIDTTTNPNDTTGVGLTNLSREHIQVYPNPVEHVLYINKDGSGPYSYKIYSVIGKVVRSGITLSKLTTVDVSDLSGGWYILTLTRPNGEMQNYRFIKEE